MGLFRFIVGFIIFFIGLAMLFKGIRLRFSLSILTVGLLVMMNIGKKKSEDEGF